MEGPHFGMWFGLLHCDEPLDWEKTCLLGVMKCSHYEIVVHNLLHFPFRNYYLTNEQSNIIVGSHNGLLYCGI